MPAHKKLNGYASRPNAGALLTLVLLVSVAVLTATAAAQDNGEGQDKSLDVRSPVGDLHVGNDASPREAGLPVYPGARLRQKDEDRNSANLALFTSAFGMKLVVLNYDSDDPAEKVIGRQAEKIRQGARMPHQGTRRRPQRA